MCSNVRKTEIWKRNYTSQTDICMIKQLLLSLYVVLQVQRRFWEERGRGDEAFIELPGTFKVTRATGFACRQSVVRDVPAL